MVMLHRTLGGLSFAREFEVCADWEQVVRPHLDYAIAVAEGRVNT